ncbi:type II toxin-antitoxin system VapB family antitoxin [Ornithinimicrobium sp. W1665]|uniref:type II toxin-antitoxin system VapB family antitoxin n=1 Tax=Ornithinimicrobium sp. W1665 TaxID=3416666 RepID=UPI003CF2D20F
MGLNIKNERTHALVKELARRTGRSQTSAVEEAVAARLATLGEDVADPAREQRLDAARAVVAAFRADLTDEDVSLITSADHDLYDEKGLPR